MAHSPSAAEHAGSHIEFAPTLADATITVTDEIHGTPTRRTEEALRESESQLKLVLETAPISIVHVDRQLRIKFANRAYLQRIRKPAHEVIGHHLQDIIGPANLPLIQPHVQRVLGGHEVRYDLRLTYPHLGEREVQVRCSPELAPDGSVRGIVAVIEDVTERTRHDAELRASEQRLSAIFAGAATGLSEISLDGRFERVNDELCRMLGRPREALRGTGILEVTHPDDIVATIRSIGQMIHTGERVSVEKRYVRPDGQIVWAHSMLTRLDDERGNPRSVLAVTVDLTSRREAERALTESEAKFRTLADASPAVIWFVDASGDIRYVNRRYLEFFGKTESEVLGQDWRPPVHPDDAQRYTEEMLVAVRDCRPLACRARFCRHDGEWRWIESQALPHFGEDGRYLGHVGHSLDVTERLETTEALRLSEDRLRRATEIETVGIAFFNVSGRITQTNAAFLQMSGYTAEDVAAGFVRIDRMTPSEFRALTQTAIDELLTFGRTFPYEKEYIRKDGTRWWGLFAATRLSEDEGVEFVIDISERKRGEEELRGYHDELEQRVLHRTAELDALNGTLRDEIIERTRAEQARQELLRQLVTAQEEERRRISRELHDQVGQDITALMLGLKALERQSGAPPSQADLQKLQALTQAIGKQIHDLALEIRPTALDDLGLLRTLSNYVDDWSKRSGIEVEFHSSGWDGLRLPSQVETTLYRIVCEALNNVVKHANATRVSLIIEHQRDQAVAIIEDDGRGFDLERQQASGANRLGLVGMRERAALAGGDLNIESSRGSGTTVFVRVPLQLPSHR